MKKYDTLIMGASYGSLLATKLLFAGHNVTARVPAGGSGADQQGRRPRAPAGQGPGRVWSRSIRASCRASCPPAAPGGVDPADYDLVALAMQEPQYRSPGVRELLDEVAKSQGAVHVDHEHAAAAVSRAHSRASTPARCGPATPIPRSGTASIPRLMTLCSPDPQAFRPPEEQVNVLQVSLPTNFKAARFDSDEATAMLRSCRPTSRRSASIPATARRSNCR